MSPTRTPHRCARNERCSNRVRLEHNPACACQCHGQNVLDATCDVEGGCGSNPDGLVWFEGGAIITSAGLCEACTTRVFRALEELPLDYVELHFLLASGESGITSDVVTGSRELQIPMRVSVEALQASMVHEVQAWAEPLAARLGIAWTTRQVRPGWILGRAAKLLANGLGSFLALPEQRYRYARDCDWVTRDGIGGALELMRMHDLIRFAAGKTKLIHKLPTPCPRCERIALCRHNGTDHVVCEGCGAFWPKEQYKRLALVIADEWGDAYVAPEHKHLISCAEGTVGSAAGGYQVPWPASIPVFDTAEPDVSQLVAEFVAQCESEQAA